MKRVEWCIYINFLLDLLEDLFDFPILPSFFFSFFGVFECMWREWNGWASDGAVYSLFQILVRKWKSFVLLSAVCVRFMGMESAIFVLIGMMVLTELLVELWVLAGDDDV